MDLLLSYIEQGTAFEVDSIVFTGLNKTGFVLFFNYLIYVSDLINRKYICIHIVTLTLLDKPTSGFNDISVVTRECGHYSHYYLPMDDH